VNIHFFGAQESEKKLKQKQRDRMQPKMGKLDIDYEMLHNAFFKHQTKPNMTQIGDVYYEGKEFEAKVRNAKPGVLSRELQAALGMTENSPPPWLINMQRYGPPPSYPDLKVSWWCGCPPRCKCFLADIKNEVCCLFCFLLACNYSVVVVVGVGVVVTTHDSPPPWPINVPRYRPRVLP
jgi:hypothetical protein